MVATLPTTTRPLPFPPPDITPEQIIEQALAILHSRERWAKHVLLARGLRGECGARDERATSWSLLGALRRAAWDLGLPAGLPWAEQLWSAYDRVDLEVPRPHTNMVSFNNHAFTTYEDIVGVLRKALDGGHSQTHGHPGAPGARTSEARRHRLQDHQS